MKSFHPALLPAGLSDLLPEDAALEAHVIRALTDCFRSYGYRMIKPPLIEFEDSLLDGPGAGLARETFRLMDPASQRMLALRSDITPQIARIAASRLRNVPRPLRLFYAGDVLRVRGSQLRPERQYVQAGCELIGEPGIEADIEIAVLALTALTNLGISGLAIDLNLPPLLKKILNRLDGSDPVRRRALKEAADRRDIEALRALGGEAGALFCALIRIAGPASEAVQALRALPLPGEARENVDILADVSAGILAALAELGLSDIPVTVDPLERRGFEYETGVSFAIFARGVRGELGRGGHYMTSFAPDTPHAFSEPASGFTVYLDSVCRALPHLPAPRRKTVPAGTSWQEVRRLQREGWSVVRIFGAQADDESGAPEKEEGHV